MKNTTNTCSIVSISCGFVNTNTTRHDIVFFILDTNTTRKRIRILISSQFRFVSCIFFVSCP